MEARRVVYKREESGPNPYSRAKIRSAPVTAEERATAREAKKAEVAAKSEDSVARERKPELI